MNHLRSGQRIAFGLAILFPIAALAQSAVPPESKPQEPADPSAVVAAAPYKSVFADYQAYKDPELIPWRKSNDDVRMDSDASGGQSMDGMTMPMQMRAPSAKSPTATPSHSMPAMDAPKKAKE